ncbi:MAG: transcription termination factor NusA, partial [Chloroflexota bacterium]
PGERYRPHDKVRALLLEVKRNSRGPQIVVSRAHKLMLRRLLEYEVPEIYNGQVEIKNIAREAGHRSKVAVAALQEGVDPVGACVGMRGIRIQNIVKELSDEKIDVIEWNPDPAIFIGKALSPARVSDMLLEEDLDTGRTATVIVPDDQLSLAIGREGQNARLAAKLTGWRIDIKSVSEAVMEAFDRLDQPPLNALYEEEPALVAEVARIVEKKRANRPIPPEEYKTLTEFVKVAERRLLGVREESRSERRSAMEIVRSIVPEHAFQMELEELELDEDITRALGRVANVGELMMRMLSDEEGLARLLKQGGAADDAMEAIRYALDDLVILQPPVKEAEAEPQEAEVAAAQEAAFEEEVEAEAEAVAGLAQSEPTSIFDEDAVLPPAFVEPEPAPAADDEDKPRRKEKTVRRPPVVEEPEPELDEFERRRQAKKKRTQLVFDEDRGEVVARRRRKGSRQRNEWDDLE